MSAMWKAINWIYTGAQYGASNKRDQLLADCCAISQVLLATCGGSLVDSLRFSFVRTFACKLLDWRLPADN